MWQRFQKYIFFKSVQSGPSCSLCGLLYTFPPYFVHVVLAASYSNCPEQGSLIPSQTLISRMKSSSDVLLQQKDLIIFF